MHELAPLADVEMAVQYTWARFWGATVYPDDVVTISDIDTLPLSPDYFVTQLRRIADDRYVILTPSMRDTPAEREAMFAKCDNGTLNTTDFRRIPACWHVARGRLFKEILRLPDAWNQAARKAAPDYTEAPARKRRYATVWDGDERHLTRAIHNYHRQSVFKILIRQKTHTDYAGLGDLERVVRHRRLRRICVWDSAFLKRGHYLFAHLPQPCVPQSLALANCLLDGGATGKARKALAIEQKYLRSHGALRAKAVFIMQLLALACAKNHAPPDAVSARFIVVTVKNIIRRDLGKIKTLRRLRDFLIPRN